MLTPFPLNGPRLLCVKITGHHSLSQIRAEGQQGDLRTKQTTEKWCLRKGSTGRSDDYMDMQEPQIHDNSEQVCDQPVIGEMQKCA